MLPQSSPSLEELSSPSTPSPSSNNSINDQLSSYREKHRGIKEKKRNQDMASLTGFLIASKYEPSTTLPSSGLERYFPKVSGFCDNTPTNSSRSKVSFRASNVRGRGLPTVQPGSWFKPSIQQDEVTKTDDTTTTNTSSSSSSTMKEEELVLVSSSNGHPQQTCIPSRM